MQTPPSCKKSRTPRPRKHNADRLSVLPDDILQRVFSFLDFLDVVRTSVLSKRLKSIWKSVPCLNFDMEWHLKHLDLNLDKRIDPYGKFWDFVKSSLLLRDNSTINKIQISCSNTVIQQLNLLICVAGREKVPELILLGGDYSSDELEFPRGACESLTFLKLHFVHTITLRAVAVFSSIVSLSLRGVCITCDAAQKLFSGGCVKLEEVYLEDCQIKDVEEIDISAANLKSVTIVNVCTCKEFWVVGSFDYKLRISSPSLVSFCYIGPMLLGVSLVDTECLENITIRLLLRVPKEYNIRFENHLLSPANFVGLNFAKTLTVSSLVVKYFCPKFSDSWDPFILDNVSHLELELRYGASFIEGMISLLRFSPNIQSLFIRRKEGRSSQGKSKKVENRGSWESRVADIACLTYSVKIIQVSNLDDSEIALELMKFFLRNGKALEKMQIMHRNGERRRMRFSKLISLPKASPKVVISFPEYGERIIPWFDKGDSDTELGD
ncbi:Unknown protein [Striga hermonthica]|uniref:F-box domain-containing protein n=1 Tax=Striga hermonthica TaxID=68872 RepID=A0A9N7N494_STRHE|nr:Unknown protein [Striga hermonthica]